jgi:8-oxo-dGTP pyrophosphatase MutT (NUDIX family)
MRFTYKIVAKVLLRTSDNSYLIIRRSKTDIRRPLQWDLPGGSVEDGENYEAAAAREAEEETGLAVSSKSLELVYSKTEMHPKGSIVFLFYIGFADSKEVILSSEHDSYKWLSLDEAESIIGYPLHKEFVRYVQNNSANKLKA